MRREAPAESLVLLRDRLPGAATATPVRPVSRRATWGSRAERNLLLAFDLLVCAAVLSADIAATAAVPPSALVAAVLGVIPVAAGLGLYSVPPAPSLRHEVGRLGVAVAVPVIAVALWLAPPPPLALAEVGVVLLLLLVVGRAAAHLFIRVLRSRRVIAERVVLVGSGGLAGRVLRTMVDQPWHGLQPVGLVGNIAHDGVEALPSRLPGMLAEQARVLRADRVVVAFGGAPADEVIAAVRALEDAECEVWVVPRFYDVMVPHRPGERVGHFPLVRLGSSPGPWSRWRRRRRRRTAAR